jgi:hypothetical protein
MTIKTADLFRLTFKRDSGKEGMPVMGIYRPAAEELLTIVAFTAEAVLLGLRHFVYAQRFFARVSDMGSQVNVASAALMQLFHRNLSHPFHVGMTGIFPGVELVRVAGLAGRNRRHRFRRFIGFDWLGYPCAGTTDNRKAKANDEK